VLLHQNHFVFLSHQFERKNRQLNQSSRLHQSESKAIMKKSLQIWLNSIQMRRSIMTKMTRFLSNWRYFMTSAIVLMSLNQSS
jgi:heme/copper-type cytochrome/quinol oxidase subunit 1